MKKYFLSMLAMAAMLLIVSCSKDDTTDADKNATVSFDITTSELATRAYGDGTKALHLMYAVYDETTLTADGKTPVVTGVSKLELGLETETEFTSLNAKVKLSLLSGNEYSILFWAAAEGYDDAYTILWDEKCVVMNNNIPGNVEAYDSFFWYEPKFKVNGSISKPITLARPFAQLNIGTNDKDEALLAGMEVTETKVVVKNVPTILDVTNGNVAGEGDVTYKYGAVPTEDTDNKFHVDGYKYLAMNYVLAGEDKIFSDIVLSHKSATKEFTNTYPSIPLQRNHRTNVYGSILTNSADYEVNIEDEFGGNHNEQLPEYNRIADGVMQPKDDLNTYLISSVEGMAWVAANVGDDGFAGKTIKLANDIDLAGVTFDAIGYNSETGAVSTFEGTFDGNGKSIKNISQQNLSGAYKQSVGLFAKVNDATFKNLTVEDFSMSVYGAEAGVVATWATGDCTFENITIKDGDVVAYNCETGGVLGWAETGNFTFKDITIGSDVNVTSLWDSYDTPVGGIIGGIGSSNGYDMYVTIENVNIACKLDVYNDVCSNYQWGAYRRAGMLIGNIRKTQTIDGITYPDPAAENITCSNVTVTYGDWMNYHYCEFESNGKPSYASEGEWKYSRVEASDWGSDGIDTTQCNHDTDEAHNEYFPIDQLFGGGQGVYGLTTYPGVTVNYPESYFREIGYKVEGDTYTVYSGNGFKHVATNVLNDGSKNISIELANDIDLTGIEWPAVKTNAAFKLNGKGYSIKNLITSAVEDHGFYSTAMFTSTRKATTIKNVVIENATVTGKGGDNSHGAVLVACNYADLTIEGVTVKNSTVSNCDRSSVIATYLYFTSATVKDCVVEGCTVNSIGTAGALLGMNNSHNFVATGNTVKNTNISSSEGENKAGILIGTWQKAGTLTQDANVVENSKAINAGTETNNNIGREV